MLDITKKYKTRSGYVVTGLFVALDYEFPTYPIIGYIKLPTDEGTFDYEAADWTEDGIFDIGHRTDSDLVEVRVTEQDLLDAQAKESKCEVRLATTLECLQAGARETSEDADNLADVIADLVKPPSTNIYIVYALPYGETRTLVGVRWGLTPGEYREVANIPNAGEV